MVQSINITFRADKTLQAAVAKGAARHKPPSASNWIRSVVLENLRHRGLMPRAYKEMTVKAGGRAEAPLVVSETPRVLGFRADPELLTAIDKAAAANTWTRSIYLRSVVVEELKRQKLLPKDYTGAIL